MQVSTTPHIEPLNLGYTKQRIKTVEDFFRSDRQKLGKSEEVPKNEFKTQNSEEDGSQLDQFGKTHFRTRIKQLNSSKVTAFKYPESKKNNMYLQKIDEKLRKNAIFSQRDRQLLLNRSDMFKFPGFCTTKNGRFRSPKTGSFEGQRECQPQLEIRPLTLKRRINMIKKHKELMEKQFQERKASFDYHERALSKEEYRLQTYKSKFEKVRSVRQERERERMSNSLEREMQNEEIIRRNYMLKSRVMGSEENLKNSRVSMCLEKVKLAKETRMLKQQNMEELKWMEEETLKQKKQQCEEVKEIRARTHQSVEQCTKKKIVTVNQRKLQEISRDLVSLESEKKMQNSFYRTNEVNDSYQNKIRNKKIEMLQKAKVYKVNLMLELNRSHKVNRIKNEEEQLSNIRNSTNTEPHRKKKDSLEISTAMDMNFLATKSNCIYKRWNNPLIAEKLRTQPSDSRE